MLGKGGGDDVRAVVVTVDPAEPCVGVGFGDWSESVTERETYGHDQVVSSARKGL